MSVLSERPRAPASDHHGALSVARPPVGGAPAVTAFDGGWEVRSAMIRLRKRWASCSPGKSFNPSLGSSLRGGEATQRRRTPAVVPDWCCRSACTHSCGHPSTGPASRLALDWHSPFYAALFAPRSKVAVVERSYRAEEKIRPTTTDQVNEKREPSRSSCVHSCVSRTTVPTAAARPATQGRALRLGDQAGVLRSGGVLGQPQMDPRWVAPHQA